MFNSIKKIIFLLIFILTFAAMVYFLITNTLNGQFITIAVGMKGESINIAIRYLISGLYTLGLIGGLSLIFMVKESYNEEIKKYKNKVESLSIKNECSSDDTEVLKRKIASLEIALQKALNK